MKQLLALSLILINFQAKAYNCDEFTVAQMMTPVDREISLFENAINALNQSADAIFKGNDQLNIDIQELVEKSRTITTQAEYYTLVGEEKQLKKGYCRVFETSKQSIQNRYDEIVEISSRVKIIFEQYETEYSQLAVACINQNQQMKGMQIENKKKYLQEILMQTGHYPTLAQVLGKKDLLAEIIKIQDSIEPQTQSCVEILAQ